MPNRSKRIVLTTFGSLGDLHPYIAIALGLKARGHEAILATSECYRQKIEALKLGFRPIRPDSSPVSDPDVMKRFVGRLALVRLVREMILPVLRESYDDILAATEDADLLVAHPLTAWAARLVAEKTGRRWASTMLVPLGFFSAHDLSVFPLAPWLSKELRFVGRRFWGPLFWFGARATRFIAKPWYRLRSELGLPPTSANPFNDSYSPALVLAPFSKLLADKQPDWPQQAVVTGFPVYDQDGEGSLPPELVRFLGDGPPPVVFTLGSAMATVAGSFYETSAAAAKLLGRRAILILRYPRNRPPALPDGVVAFDYAPFSQLFPRVAAIVHAGGIGTTGLAMRAGRPTLVLPYAFDQPDNAERAVRLGIARTICRRHYTPARVAAELRQLLENPAYARRASEVAEEVRREDGVGAACDALEGLTMRNR